MKKWKIFIVPGSHFDLGWTSTPAESFARGDEIIKEAADWISGDYPDYKFTIEYAWFLKHFLERHPDYRGRIKKLLKEGKIEVCASSTGMMDQILDGELMIRQVVYAKQWAGEELGRDLQTAQLTDCPGHSIQLPQVLSKSGVKYLAYSRFGPQNGLHWWQAPDGSKVLAANHSIGLYKGIGTGWPDSGYGWTLTIGLRDGIGEAHKKLSEQLKLIEKTWYGNILLMGDEGDLLRGSPGICRSIQQWNIRHRDIKMQLSTITEFFKAVSRESATVPIQHQGSRLKLPVFCGEAPYEFYSIPAFEPVAYKLARMAENRLASAEKFMSLNEILGLGKYPVQEIRNGWQGLFYCHDHNVGGMHGEINDRIRRDAAQASFDTGSSLLEEVFYNISANIKYTTDELPVVVFNPLNWNRDDIVIVSAIIHNNPPQSISIMDKDGKEMPSQIISREGYSCAGAGKSGPAKFRLAFLAKDVPGLGYRTFYIHPCDRKVYRGVIHHFRKGYSTKFFSIKFSNQGITSLKYRDRELVKKDIYAFYQAFILEDTAIDISEAFTGKFWKARYDSSRIVENGPLKGTILLKGKVHNSSLEQEITFYEYSPRIDLKVTVDWQGQKNTQLRLAFPLNIPGGQITYEVPFAAVRFPQDEMPDTYRGTGGRYIQKWVDVSNKNFGATVSADSACCSFKEPSFLYPVLLRVTYSCGDPFSWYYNKGKHSFNFSLYPHEGNWQKSLSFRRGWEFNNPLMPDQRRTMLFYLDQKPQKFLPEEFGLLKVSVPNVVITTIKKADRDTGYIVRLFETAGISCKVSLKFSVPVSNVWETDLMEQNIRQLKVKENTVELNATKFGIHTLKFKMRDRKGSSFIRG